VDKRSVDGRRSTGRQIFRHLVGPLYGQGDPGRDPLEDAGVIHLHASVQQHELEIAVADEKHQIPSHRPQDHLGGELAAFESLILPYACCCRCLVMLRLVPDRTGSTRMQQNLQELTNRHRYTFLHQQ
jgi:hypothetical protein